MTPEKSNLTRREFVIVGAAAVSVPLIWNLSVLAPKVKAAEAPAPARAEEMEFDDSRCRGCQVCTIFFSVCPTVNNRVCWCEQ
jgi:hypothetical protein